VRVAGLVLAAGAATRFGSPKVLARLEGRAVLEHVLTAARSSGLDPIVVVLGDAADAIEAQVSWAGERRVRNPDPGRGLSSSVAIGLEAIGAIDPPVDGAVILLGDQPLTRPDVIRALVSAPQDSGRPVVVPRYADGGGANPILVRREAFALVGGATGDRGLGPLLAANPDLVATVPVPGSNPDVDTRADLAAVAAAAWDARVLANRAQVDRFREVPDGRDFYAPVSSLFRADPARADDPSLVALLELVEPGDTVLDIGCGAGRYALPLARRVRHVIGLDPSTSMLDALRDGMQEYGISNVDVVHGRWPAAGGDLAADAAGQVADVSLIAHVGYDVEPIAPFLEAMEAVTRRLCVAILMDPPPAAIASPFWPAVHGEARVPLPAAGAFIDLLAARGRAPEVEWVDRPPRGYRDRDDLLRFLRQQLWVAPGGAKDARLDAAIDELAEERAGKWYVRDDRAGRIAVIRWTPPGPAGPSEIH
jgi:CTP:molybdopterin cytidylyltransferase MocA/SAM-dependent methyltransferase